MKEEDEKINANAFPASAMHQNRRREVVIAFLLIICVITVGFFGLMTSRSRNTLDQFLLTADDFDGFVPIRDDWVVRVLEVQDDPLEPNILAYHFEPIGQGLTSTACPVLVRLVHGYNMCDCMRIKGYEIDLLKDTRRIDAASDKGDSLSESSTTPQLQIWQVTSSSGDVSIWVTSMIRAYDMSETSLDTRSMAFPRVNVPDAQGWFPRGFTWSSLRHPVQGTRRFLRAKWNASRCDWLTFLRLRRPAWASQEVLTLVASSHGRSVADDSIDQVIASVAEAHQAMYQEILRWQASRSSPEDN